MKQKIIALRLEDEDYRNLKSLVQEGESLSAYIRDVLRKHIIKENDSEKKSFIDRLRNK